MSGHVHVTLSRTGLGVTVDGQKVPNVAEVRVYGRAGRPTEVTLELIAVTVDCEAERPEVLVEGPIK